MGQVVQIASPCSLDEAWEAYRSHAAKAFDEPRLGLDRAYMEQHARLYRRWSHLFAIEGRS